MTFTVPSHLPRQVDVSSQILSKLDAVTFHSLDSSVAYSWRAELDESIRLTKKRIHDRIHSDLPAFEAQLASATSAQHLLQSLTRDVNVLRLTVSDPENGLTPTLLAALRRYQALAQASLNADVLHASLSHISECKTQLENVQRLVESGDLPAAVPASAKLALLLDTTPQPLGEATITSDMRSKLHVLANRIEELLDNAYTSSVAITSTDITIRPLCLIPNSANPIPLSAILSSLSASSLSAHMSALRRDITLHCVDNTLEHPTRLSVSQEPDPFGSFVYRLQRIPSSVDDATPLSNLSRILEFINERLFPCLPQSQRERFSRSLAKPLATSIMNRLLIPCLPSKMDALPTFLELTRNAVDFETKHIVGLLKGDNFEREIKNWADNVCAHYERGRRKRILDNIRETILATVLHPKDTFTAELAMAVNVTPAEPVLVIPTSKDDRHTSNGASRTDLSSSSIDSDDAWGFDDDVEEAETPRSTPGSMEEDPGEAWGWNDEVAEGQPEETSHVEQTNEQDEVWDDPWADDPVSGGVVPPVQSASRASTSTASSRQQASTSRTNGHTVNGNHLPAKVDKESYQVSVLIRRIVRTVEDALNEGKTLAMSGIFPKVPSSASTPGTLIMQSSALVLDLYRALHPVMIASKLPQPAGCMLFCNDCFYLSEEMSRVLRAEEGTSVQERLEECKDDLGVLSESWFYRGIDRQIAALEDVLVAAEGFKDTSSQERYDECEMVISQILRDVRNVAHVWKPILPKGKYYTAVGLVVESVLSRILESILAISDIPEVESHKLSELCRILTALEGLFVEDTSESSFVLSYVPSWLKFSYLSELLEASMADLTYLFEEGALVDFEIKELAMLVRALFADTPLRTKTIDKIMHGHPVR